MTNFNNNILFNIIVPTLNRADTLYWTLKTLIEQDYHNFRIIVSDNCSTDNTKEVVSSFNDSRISYIKPTKKLSMSHHWEFALNHIESGFVTILGDDDGMLPNALRKINFILNKHKIDVISWNSCNFNWFGLPVYFKIPTLNLYSIKISSKVIADILSSSIVNTIEFPSIYGGFVNIDLIKKIKEKTNNVFFHSRIPDFYSAAAIISNTEKYIRCEFPFTINATSKNSTGFLALNSSSSELLNIEIYSSNNEIKFHNKMIFNRCLSTPIAEALLQASDRFSNLPSPKIEIVINDIIHFANTLDSTEEKESLFKSAIEICRINNIDFEYFKTKVSDKKTITTVYTERFSPISFNLYLDSKKRNLTNVHEATKEVTRWVSNKIIFNKTYIHLILIKIITSIRILIRLKIH